MERAGLLGRWVCSSCSTIEMAQFTSQGEPHAHQFGLESGKHDGLLFPSLLLAALQETGESLRKQLAAAEAAAEERAAEAEAARQESAGTERARQQAEQQVAAKHKEALARLRKEQEKQVRAGGRVSAWRGGRLAALALRYGAYWVCKKARGHSLSFHRRWERL